MRSNGSPLFTRCVQINLNAALLNSDFCYILKVPFGQDEDSGIAYVWLGEKSDEEEGRLCEEIAQEMYDPEKYSLQVRPNNRRKFHSSSYRSLNLFVTISRP